MCFRRFRVIRFIKDDMGWYADIPTHSREDNEMVAGADTLLDELSGQFGKCNSISLMVSKRRFPSPVVLLHLYRIKHDDEGAVYKIVGGTLTRELGLYDNECWLCNVVHDVFKEYPENIYITGFFPSSRS